MVEWWGENGPPVYVSVAGYLGLIKKKPKSVSKGGTGNLAEIFKHFGQDGMLH